MMQTLQYYLDNWENLPGEHTGPESAPLNMATRRAAAKYLAEHGLPGKSHEGWQNTDLAAIQKSSFRFPSRIEVHAHDDNHSPAAFHVATLDGIVIRSAATDTLPPGVIIGSIADLQNAAHSLDLSNSIRDAQINQPIEALNALLHPDSIIIRIPAGTILPKPIWIQHTLSGAPQMLSLPRVVVVAGADSRVEIFEEFRGTARASLTISSTILQARENSQIQYTRLQDEGESSWHLGALNGFQERASRIWLHTINSGLGSVRNDATAVLMGEGAELSMFGAYLVAGDGRVDNSTLIEHAAPHTVSRELYRGILDGRGHGSFRGRIVVQKKAQQTDAVQTNQNIMLSGAARVNTDPQLEIYADDVRCKHGSTVGRLDDDALFYIRSRGIDQQEARRLLLQGFAGGILEHIGSQFVRELCLNVMVDWIDRSRNGSNGHG